MAYRRENLEKEKNLFLETDLSLHEHCQNCVSQQSTRCQNYGCSIIPCPHECSMKFHSCKTEEHLLLCPLVKTPCINVGYGCPLWMLRKDLSKHLSSCPASIVYCNMERNRKPIREFAKQLKRKEARIAEIDSADVPLDLALAYSDQHQINDLYRLPRQQRKAKTNFFNKRHPALPLINSIGSPIDNYPLDDGDSSEDEALARKRSQSLISAVASECVLCKIDPSSQHLHQLRGAGGPLAADIDIELDENANESSKNKKWTTCQNIFYVANRLMIDLSPDFLPAHYPKCGSYYTIVCDQSIRRDEYARHFSNVHNDIVDGLDGWALLRCPMWRQGCTYYATRLKPKDGRRKIVYNLWRDTFAVQFSNFPTPPPKEAKDDDEDEEEALFLDLPLDILCLVCSMLDSSSLFCLAGTCRSMNELIRYSLLPSRGLVDRIWIKDESSKTAQGRQRWVEGGKRWRLSKSFENIREWSLQSTGHLVDHIQKCPYYEPLIHHQDRIPVLAFVKPFVTRPSRRYRAGYFDQIDHENQVFDF